MKLPMVTLVFAVLVAVQALHPAWAQNATPAFEPKVSETGKRFLDIADGSGQRTKVQYLHPDTKPELRKAEEQTDISNLRTNDPRLRTAAIVFLIALIGVLVWLWWRNSAGGGLFARGIGDGQSGNGEALDPAGALTIGAEGQIPLTDIAKIIDPREGMRKLMISALLSAAAENKIAVRRSQTARDVLRNVPASWQRKPILQELVGRAELVLFGGRPINNQQFADLLELAKPLFGNTNR